MTLSSNPNVTATEAPPIAEAASWLAPERFGPDTPLIDVCQAVPGYPPDAGLRAHVAERAAAPDSAFYTEIEGLPGLRRALAAEMSSFYAGDVRPDDVLIAAGCNQAFYLAITALAKAGESVALPVPWYFNHKMTLDILGVEAIPIPCSADAGMVPDPATAAERLRPDTRAIVLVSPNNPTGAVYPAAALEAFLDLAAERGIALVVDETYRDFLAPGAGRPHALFERPGWRGALVHLYSFSKVFSLTGYRVGALVADPAFVAEAAKVMDCMAICAPALGQHAALWGIGNLDGWRRDKRALMAERVAAFEDAMGASNAGFRIRSIGAYFAYVEHPFAAEDAAAVARRLAGERNLLCLPGTMFGPGQERMLRFAFANVDASVMPAIAERLAG